jgi:hypothetical protein
VAPNATFAEIIDPSKRRFAKPDAQARVDLQSPTRKQGLIFKDAQARVDLQSPTRQQGLIFKDAPARVAFCQKPLLARRALKINP